MPIVASTFRPPWWARGGHFQTILPAFRRRPRPAFERERLELPDGDFLDLDWLRGGYDRLAILSHGLEGDTRADYIRGMAAALAAAGWDVLAWTFRGCGPEPNRLLRFYHSGETGDLRELISRCAPRFRQIALVGFSLGGNMVLKLLEEDGWSETVAGAVAISAPVDLAASARALDRHPGNRLYLRRFLKTLVAKIQAKAAAFPGQIDLAGIEGVRSFAQFDDRYTARLHGFKDAEDYWTRSSARAGLARIAVPTLLLNAVDDPFLPPACFPYAEAGASASLFLEAPAHGGHVGFLDFAPGETRTWAERRTVEFLAPVPGANPA